MRWGRRYTRKDIRTRYSSIYTDLLRIKMRVEKKVEEEGCHIVQSQVFTPSDKLSSSPCEVKKLQNLWPSQHFITRYRFDL